MKRYGFRIGEVGIEFVSIEDRDKAIKDFTHGSVIRISESGIRYHDDDRGKAFSVYDRETSEIIAVCNECAVSFSIESCPKREYPKKNSWEKDFSSNEAHVCDACFAVAVRKKEVFDAKKIFDTDKED